MSACISRVRPLLIFLVLLALLGSQARSENSTPPPTPSERVNPPAPSASVQSGAEEELDALALEGDLVAGLKPLIAPDDPCLPPLYKDWGEVSLDSRQERSEKEFMRFRVILDRSSFRLTLEGLRKDGSSEDLYDTPVGVGDLNSPTPDGQFYVNHLYPYPDVLFFGTSGERIRGLYKGFFAPLLVCDETGRCERFRDLGMHGFDPAAYPHPLAIRHEVCGAVSSGCIRVPEPCKLKAAFIRLVGIGPLKRNDRGFYHWLDQPVEVLIIGEYPFTDTTLVSVFETGLNQVQNGLKSLLNIFGP